MSTSAFLVCTKCTLVNDYDEVQYPILFRRITMYSPSGIVAP